MIITLDNAIAKYGPIVNGAWPDSAKWCSLVKIPQAIRACWINSFTKNPVGGIYCNSDMSEPLMNALNNALNRGLISLLKTFDGCYSVRDVRGEPGKPSCHSYGLAIDINAATNQLGTEGDMNPDLVKCFKDAGFSWGGDFKRLDPMHYSFAWE